MVMKLFPILQAPKAGAKPTTIKRFDSVFTALNLFVQLAGWSFAKTLQSLLQLLYNRTTTLLFTDPPALSAVLKIHRAHYLAFIRGGRVFADSVVTLTTGLLDSESGLSTTRTRIYDRVTDYRNELVEGGALPRDLLAFDRIVFAILSFDRIMTYSVDPNFDTITKPSDFKYPTDGSFFPNLPLLLERLGITKAAFWAEVRRQAKAQRHVIMSTAGVNGPASWSAHSDAKVILGNTYLYKHFRDLAQRLGLNWLLQDMLSTVSIPAHDSTNDTLLREGRLHTFEEWGGKTRIVAIVDYWTQVLMTPIHNAIFTFLKRIPADGTFDQDAATERVRLMTGQSNLVVNSFDLTAATDRLPISIQVEILSYLIGSDAAKSWAALLVGRDYFHKESNKSYRYAAGQPMGSKSSWAMLALTHHVIVQAASVMVSTSPYTEYALLGDDITLTDADVSRNYLNIMRSLFVDINMTKSVVHHADALPAAEFAKRVFVNGNEISTFPVKLTAKTIMNGRLAPQLQNELFRRGESTSSSFVLSWLIGLVDIESAQFLTILNNIPSSLTSLSNPIPFTNKFLGKMETWLGDSYVLTPRDLLNAHLYVAVTEQLKRIDNLLRQAQVIHSAIETNAFGYSTFDPARILGWNYSDPEIDMKKLAATMPQLSPTHPIMRAAQDEIDRLGALLADLRSGDTQVVLSAQQRLLDSFRSALVDAWLDTDAARAQADRSLIQKAMQLITDLVFNRVDNDDPKRSQRIEFTINLAYINRLWTVSWKLGGDLSINAVKARVLSTQSDVDARVATLFDATSIKDIFHVAVTPKRKRKGVRVDQTPTAKVISATDNISDPSTSKNFPS